MNIKLDSIQGLEEIKDSAAESCRGGFASFTSFATSSGRGSAVAASTGTTQITRKHGRETFFAQSTTFASTNGNATAISSAPVVGGVLLSY